jgi:hypothetical protein
MRPRPGGDFRREYHQPKPQSMKAPFFAVALGSGLLLLAVGHSPVRAESNEEFGRRLHRSLEDFRKQTDAQKLIPQRPAETKTIGSDGEIRSRGSWDDAVRRQSPPPASEAPSPIPDSSSVEKVVAQADAASSSGDFDAALELLTHAAVKSPNDQTLLSRINALRMAKLNREVHEANSRRGVDLNRVLGQAEQNLPAQLRLPSPTVALGNLGSDSLDDTMTVDLSGAQSFVVDPAFFKPTTASGAPNRESAGRFAEPPVPGKPLPPQVFADSPYVAIFESPEFTELMLSGLGEEPAPKPGELNRARVAFLRRVDALPPQLIHLVTTADEKELEASRLQVKQTYEDYRQRRTELLTAAAQATLREMRSMIDGMENEGWFKRGDNLVEKEANDPLFRATMNERARVVRWYAELYLDEAENRAYREMAARVTRIMKENQK